MTREQIWAQHQFTDSREMITKCALQAMSDYARQEAIGFNEWVDMNEPTYQKGNKYLCNGHLFDSPPTTAQLYELYLKNKIV